MSLGDTDLVDATGAAVLIKPMGLSFPLMLLLVAIGLRSMAPRLAAALIALGAVVFPVAHIGNVAWLAVLDQLVLAAGFAVLVSRLGSGRMRQVAEPVPVP